MLGNSFADNLCAFSHSSLEDSKAMSFLNRYDTKFVIKNETALDFLRKLSNDYSVLKIDDQTIQNYETIYFDSDDLHCFNLHHNKRARRFKVRTRKYLSNGKIFNEIKQKLNTGKTLKIRQRRDCGNDKNNIPPLETLNDFDSHFKILGENNGYKIDHFIPQLSVFFSRITLLNKNFPERMTLDFGLRYSHTKCNNFGLPATANGNSEITIALPHTAIVELKREKSSEKTFAQNFFRSIHKEPSGFSKYTIGICLTHENAKKNRFLPRIRSLSYE
ncbi:VTC domain-containing protein [Fibrobacterales bacterium]|nr:VTC domain-containing protein [Fibrobacterales bacterium]